MLASTSTLAGPRRAILVTATLAALGLGLVACDDPNDPDARDDSCDDGSAPTCELVPPECDATEILAYQNQCFVCVNPATCAAWGDAGCTMDQECALDELCDACASSSCPACDDCVAACAPHDCATGEMVTCRALRPDCGPGAVAVVSNGCWQCVGLDDCAPIAIP